MRSFVSLLSCNRNHVSLLLLSSIIFKSLSFYCQSDNLSYLILFLTSFSILVFLFPIITVAVLDKISITLTLTGSYIFSKGHPTQSSADVKRLATSNRCLHSLAVCALGSSPPFILNSFAVLLSRFVFPTVCCFV